MSDDPRPEAPPPASEPQADVPWWSQPSGGSWDTPSYVTEPTTPLPTSPHPGTGASAPPYAGHTSTLWDVPGAPLDTLGREPRERRAPAIGLLVALALVIALLAGGAGGAAGYLLAEREDDSVTVEGTNLGAAPARSVERPANSIAGVAAKVLPSVVQIKVETSSGGGTGSGFVLDDDGFIVTNNHVVADAGSSGVTVSFADGTTADARVVGTSGSYDLAVLKVSAKGLKALPLGNSDSVVVGDPVIAIGSPLGLSGTVTSGIVSAKDRPVTAGERGGSDSAYINAIQTDAAINPGNSGGPLVNLDGEVVGVNSAIATLGGSLTGQGGSIGVGFAIPINQARRTVEQILDTGEAQFPIIGASLDGGYDGDGARIASSSATNGTPPIVPGGPAERAGLEPGDVITAIDDKPVADSSELIVAIRSRSPGDSITLTVRRGGDERTVKVTLGSSKG
jgi:putative serine protease PepD